MGDDDHQQYHPHDGDVQIIPYFFSLLFFAELSRQTIFLHRS
jgi:hypothetical protein